VLAYVAKTVAAVAASLTTALVIQVVMSLRAPDGDAWSLAPAFSHTAGLSIAVALAVVAAWEIFRPPFSGARAAAAIAAYVALWAVMPLVIPHSRSAFETAAVLVGVASVCSTLDLRPTKLLITLAAFAAAQYALHATMRVALGPARAVLAGAIQLPVWASTVVILARIDRAFMDVFNTAER
jgi:hypothetical protein